MSCFKHLEINLFVSLYWARPFTGQFLTLAFRVSATLLITQRRWQMHQWSCTLDFIQPQLGHFIQLSGAVKGKKYKINSVTVQSQISLLAAHISTWLWKLGEICPKIYFYPHCFASDLFPRAVPIPSPEQSWSRVLLEWGLSWGLLSGVLVCSAKPQVCKWGRCRNLSVLASLNTLDTLSWNPNKEDFNQRMPKWLFPFWWRLVSWTGFFLLLSSIWFFVSVHTSQKKENISQ